MLTAAGRVGAAAVFPESLYGFGPVDGPMTERTPLRATSGKPGIRVELLQARAASPTRTISVAASDFYGPEVLTSHAGERMVPRILAGRSIQVRLRHSAMTSAGVSSPLITTNASFDSRPRVMGT